MSAFPNHHYYELDGMPIRHRTPQAVPEILGPDGWRPWPYISRLLTEASVVSKEEFDACYNELKEKGWTTAANDF